MMAPLLVLGASVLLFRTLALLHGGARHVLRSWVVLSTYLEMAVDAVTLVGSLRWWASGSEQHASLALRAGAAATFIHAFRVLVFALGRVGPWRDFDVRPGERAAHGERWNWGQVVFASSMSVAGVVAVFVIRSVRGRAVAERS